MADRTAADAFGDAYAWQRKHKKPKLTKWLHMLAAEYDFAPYQMGAPEDSSPSLSPLFRVFERDAHEGEALFAKKHSAELAKLAGVKDQLAGIGIIADQPARGGGVAATLSQGFTKPTPADEGPGWGALVLAMGLGIAFAVDQQRVAQAAARTAA